MKASSKWTKWQIGLVSAMIVVYLFQEVKESPEFLKAVREASIAKLNAAKITAQQNQSQSHKPLHGQTSPQGQTPLQGQTSSPTKPHTRSHAS